MTRFNEKYKDRGFQVIAVDSEDKESREQVAEFARKNKLSHLILVGGGQAAEKFQFENSLPTSFWIDRTGRVLRRETGFRPEMEKQIERTIQELLREGEPARAASGAGGSQETTPSKKESQ